MDDRTFEKLVRDEAYAIYQWRMSWTPSWPGDEKGDWFNAIDNIRSRQVADILNISVKNRITQYL